MVFHASHISQRAPFCSICSNSASLVSKLWWFMTDLFVFLLGSPRQLFSSTSHVGQRSTVSVCVPEGALKIEQPGYVAICSLLLWIDHHLISISRSHQTWTGCPTRIPWKNDHRTIFNTPDWYLFLCWHENTDVSSARRIETDCVACGADNGK